MYCRTVPIPGPKGVTAVVCGAKPKQLPPCEFCRSRSGENQCDYQVGGPCRKCRGSGERRMSPKEKEFHQHLVKLLNGEAESSVADREQAAVYMGTFTAGIVCYDCQGSGKQCCNRFFCGDRCGIRISEKEGYCPVHQELAGHKRVIVREPCEWRDTSEGGRCLRRSCKRDVVPGIRVLYFPEQQRVMHEDCGLEYLRISVVK